MRSWMFTDVNDDSSDLDKKRIEMQIGRLSIVLDDKFILESCLSTAINLTFFSAKAKLAVKKKHFHERNTQTTTL